MRFHPTARATTFYSGVTILCGQSCHSYRQIGKSPSFILLSGVALLCGRWSCHYPIKEHRSVLEGGDGVLVKVANNRRFVVSTSILVYVIDNSSNKFVVGNGGTPCAYCEVCVFQLSSFATTPPRDCTMADGYLQRYSRTCQYNVSARRNPTGSSSSMPLCLSPITVGPNSLGESGQLHTPSSFEFNFSQTQPWGLSGDFAEELLMSPGQLDGTLGVSSYKSDALVQSLTRSSNLTHLASIGNLVYLRPPRMENYTTLGPAVVSTQAFPRHALERMPRPVVAALSLEKIKP